MLIVKSPLRISFFGGSSDYDDFYKSHGSFLIGTTIDKYCYLSMRQRPKIFSDDNVIIYSKMQCTKNIDEIQNPLIRNILKYKKIDFPIELFTFTDVPSRTGLGGSSSFCVGLLYVINNMLKLPFTKHSLAEEAIYIERKLLNESGGIQDQIWASYGGLNTIEINTNGEFFVKPLAITEDFKHEIEDSIVLIYTNHQREQSEIANSHKNKNKETILQLAKEAHSSFLKENIQNIGNLLYQSWKEKSTISNCISNGDIDIIINDVMKMGAYGSKLLGAGGCGFIMVICNPKVKQTIMEKYKSSILDFKFSNDGTNTIYK